MELEPIAVQTLGLPLETLLEIFERTVAIDALAICKHSAPTNISQTCRFWRKLSLAHGSLWTQIYAREEAAGTPLLASLWLRRAGHSLLDVHYDFELPFSPYGVARSASEIWHTTLVSKQMLWKEVETSHGEYAGRQPAHLLYNLANLKTWELCHPEPLAAAPHTSIWAMREALQLTSRPAFLVPPLDVTGGPIAPRLTTFIVCIYSHFGCLDPEGARGLVTMLQHSPNLTKLDLTMQTEFSVLEAIEAHYLHQVHLAHLKEIIFMGAGTSFEVIALIIAPALERLEFKSRVQEELDGGPFALLTFLDNSGGSNIKEVDIKYDHYLQGRWNPTPGPDLDDFEETEEDHIPILEALPNVTDLTLAFPCSELTCSLLELPNGLNPGDARGLCPKLTYLNIDVMRATDINAVRSLLSSRIGDQSEDFKAVLHIHNMSSIHIAEFEMDGDFLDWIESGALKMYTNLESELYPDLEELYTGLDLHPDSEVHTGLDLHPDSEMHTGLNLHPDLELHTGLDLHTVTGLDLRPDLDLELHTGLDLHTGLELHTDLLG